MTSDAEMLTRSLEARRTEARGARARGSFRREFRAPLLAALALWFGGCDTTAGGPEYVELAIIVTPDGERESPQTCLPVPMMPGGHTAKDARFEPGFSVHLEAVRDRVEVTFHGIIDPAAANRSLSRAALEDGFRNDIRVETLVGGADVLLVAPCRPEEEPDAGP
jgi:hypothetical protein